MQLKSLFKRCISIVILNVFFLTSLGPSYAQTFPVISPVKINTTYTPIYIKGINIHPDNPLQFDFIVDSGNSRLVGDDLEKESDKLIKYFLASLTVPEDEMWVNLSPIEKNRIISKGLGKTELGKDMLRQDYLLKQLTASLMSPDGKLGKIFWDKIKQNPQLSNVDVSNYSKVWIVPDKAVIYEHGNSAFVVESHLRVMLEEDLKSSTQSVVSGKENQRRTTDHLLLTTIKNTILPEIEKEVNTGETFANLRQIYNSMILAVWYKMNLKESLLSQVYVDQNKTKGVNHNDPQMVEELYQKYIKLFQNGVSKVIKEEYDPSTEEITQRQYFSGGIGRVDKAIIKRVDDQNQLDKKQLENLEGLGNLYQVTTDLNIDRAVTDDDKVVAAFSNDDPQVETLLEEMKQTAHKRNVPFQKDGGNMDGDYFLEKGSEFDDIEKQLIEKGEKIIPVIEKVFYGESYWNDRFHPQLLRLIHKIGGNQAIEFLTNLIKEYAVSKRKLSGNESLYFSLLVKHAIACLISLEGELTKEQKEKIRAALELVLKKPHEKSVIWALGPVVRLLTKITDKNSILLMLNTLRTDYYKHLEYDTQIRYRDEVLNAVLALADESTSQLLLKYLYRVSPTANYRIYDQHGSIVRYRKVDPSHELVDEREFKRVEEIKNPLYEGIENTIVKLNKQLRDKRKYKSLDLTKIRDQKLTDFLKWLDENGFEDIVVVGGGVRDAYFDRTLNDIDISVRIPLTEEEQREFLGTASLANERVYQYARSRLEALAKALGVSVERFFPPLSEHAVEWNGIDIQYVGPIKLMDEKNEPVYIKRVLIDANSGELYSSNTGPALLQMAMDTKGKLYGHTESLEDLEKGFVHIFGDGNNLDIQSIVRLIRLRHQLGKRISKEDYRTILKTLNWYRRGKAELYDLIQDIGERQVYKAIEKAKDPIAADKELKELGVYDILEMHNRPYELGVTEQFKRIMRRLYRELGERYFDDTKSGPRHIADLMHRVNRIIYTNSLEEDVDWDVIIAAAAMHDIFAFKAKDARKETIAFADYFLKEKLRIKEAKVEKVKEILKYHDTRYEAYIEQRVKTGIESTVLFDADQQEAFGYKGIYRFVATFSGRTRSQQSWESRFAGIKEKLLANMLRRLKRMHFESAKTSTEIDFEIATGFYAKLQMEKYPEYAKIGATGVVFYINKYKHYPPGVISEKVLHDLDEEIKEDPDLNKSDWEYVRNFFIKLAETYRESNLFTEKLKNIPADNAPLMVGKNLQHLFNTWLTVKDNNWNGLIYESRKLGFEAHILKDKENITPPGSLSSGYTGPQSTDYMEWGFVQAINIFGNAVWHGGGNALYVWRETFEGFEFLMFDRGRGVMTKGENPQLQDDLRMLWSTNPKYTEKYPYTGGGGTRLLSGMVFDAKMISANGEKVHVLEKIKPGTFQVFAQEHENYEVSQADFTFHDLKIDDPNFSGVIIHGFVPFDEDTYDGSLTKTMSDNILGKVQTRVASAVYRGPWQLQPAKRLEEIKVGQNVTIYYHDIEQAKTVVKKNIALKTWDRTFPTPNLQDDEKILIHNIRSVSTKNGKVVLESRGTNFYRVLEENGVQLGEEFAIEYEEDVIVPQRKKLTSFVKEIPGPDNMGVFVIGGEGGDVTLSMARIKEFHINNNPAAVDFSVLNEFDADKSTISDETYGGINFNSSLLNLQVIKDKNRQIKFDVPIDIQNINGIKPRIINIQPIPNLFQAIGLESSEKIILPEDVFLTKIN